MKICIFGAGAIGGYMGAKLAKAGADVGLVARGPHLAAMREKGLTLIEKGEAETVQVNASDDPAANLPVTIDLIRQAVADGAEIVFTPEVTNIVRTMC